MNNNPVRYNDPTGHCINSQMIFVACVAFVAVIAVVAYDITLSHLASTPSKDCTLVECFQNQERRVFQPNEQMSKEDFGNLLDAIATDLDAKPVRPTIDLGRMLYDTPFYDGGDKANAQNVCIDGVGCSSQSDVNYVAQGMYAGRVGQSLDDAIDLSNNWKNWTGPLIG